MTTARITIWGAYLVLLLLLSVLMLPGGRWLTGDFESLLPNTHDDKWAHLATQRMNERMDGQLILAAGDEDFLNQALSRLEQSGLTDPQFEAEQSERWKTLISILHAHRWGLLSLEDAKSLTENPQKFLEDARRRLFAPGGSAMAQNLPADPAGHFQRFWLDVIQSGGANTDINEFTGLSHALVHTSELARRFPGSTDLYEAYIQLKEQSARDAVNFHGSGGPLFMSYGLKSGRSELTTIGLLSLIVLAALLLHSLRSLSTLGLTLLSVSTAFGSGLVVTVGLLGEIHVITLVFGVTIIGVAADYAFHYVTHVNWLNQNSRATNHSIFKPISLGFGSSATAFALLTFLPFPGIRQIGVFMASGLFGAWLTVLLLFPVALRTGRARIPQPGSFTRPSWLFRLLILGVLALAAWVYSSTSAQDEVRNFYAVSDELAADTRIIENHLGNAEKTRMVIITAPDEETLLQREEDLLASWNNRSSLGISRIIPSQRRQQQNFELLLQLFEENLMEHHLEKIGISNQDRRIFVSADDIEFNPARLDLLNDIDLPLGADGFLGCRSSESLDRCASFVMLGGKFNPSQGTRLLDPVANINHMLGEYRRTLAVMIAVGLMGAGIMLSLVLRPVRAAKVLVLPTMACLAGMAIAALWQGYWTIINIMALLIVLGVGLDYSIFRQMSSVEEQTATSLAIRLSALTSILAFGMLMFSETPLINQFGITVSAGLAAAWALSWAWPRDQAS